MHISSIKITNFRGIQAATLTNLSSMVVIAGTNGSGKSTIFDALRLLKSVYGSTNRNEPEQWFGEFQMPMKNTPDAFAPMFNDRSLPLTIQATFVLAPEERSYLRKNAHRLVQEIVAKDISGDDGKWVAMRRMALSRFSRQAATEIQAHETQYEDSLLKELKQVEFLASFEIQPGGVPSIKDSRVLETVFSTSEPEHLGGLRYHSAQRNYTREPLQNVSINVVEQPKDNQQYLYGNAQYTNIKQEMATAYVKELVANAAGVPLPQKSNISDTLKELFESFFPNKTFIGARPNAEGNVYFPVQIGHSSTHDLDDLSSGEKEIVYGYLRMRNSSPKHSIVLIDEPELHLNSRLIGGLPDFYHKHLGQGLQNQLWLVTHSDMLLRQSLGRKDFSVYHMQPATSPDAGKGQAISLRIDDGARDAVLALVGDLAAYRPGAKLVLFEGDRDAQFDVTMVERLFPTFANTLNLISVGSKSSVLSGQSIIETVDKKSSIYREVYSITDRDWDTTPNLSPKMFQWDRYHIENYLLDFGYISSLASRASNGAFTAEQVEDTCKKIASDLIDDIVRHKLLMFATATARKVIKFDVAPASSVATTMHTKIASAAHDLAALATGTLDAKSLSVKEAEIRKELRASLRSKRWTADFPGREILKRFFGKHLNGMSYPQAINLLISDMAKDGYEPAGMRKLLEKIASL